ncbi:unnamed protein product [Ostreobium quekettii]|uniref:Lipocalin/cytosolic fatty-acid binding domain-containing protein n=1 Tax=Ostreobium quekettii TaxID=121088 RepID=A0A8S1IY89_9CHLO|nr:unnamed protein product [Ostreobium quekettii]|eukprot:evm.model.scf_182.5 EVM.evm.TU.scf_182.5   scf_182:51860-53853(-)
MNAMRGLPNISQSPRLRPSAPVPWLPHRRPRSAHISASRVRPSQITATDRQATIEDRLMSCWTGALAASAAIALAASLFPGAAAAAEYKKGGEDLFDPMRYTGRWYEVASLKLGFAGEGQQDCHCTQGIYTPKQMSKGKIALEVSTFCVHGSPQGRVSGIQGQVSCAPPAELKMNPAIETALERKEMIEEKCVLRFPAIPFIPPEPYDVIRTDYDNYALVQGAVDTSFVQIYSRKPNPGKKFIEQQKAFLADFGYPVGAIRDTPQDCPVVPIDALTSAMGEGTTMESMMKNTMPSSVKLSDIPGVEFAGPRNALESVKDFVTLLKREEGTTLE